MNKLAVLAVISVICAGCVPAGKTPVAVQAPPPALAVVVAPKAEVVGQSAQHVSPPSYPKNAIVRQKPLASIAVYPGSLKENVDRIAAHYGWRQVVWDAPQDFMWVGYAQIQGDTLASVLHQLLADYPLQAILYQGNHVLYIHPRTLK